MFYSCFSFSCFVAALLVLAYLFYFFLFFFYLFFYYFIFWNIFAFHLLFFHLFCIRVTMPLVADFLVLAYLLFWIFSCDDQLHNSYFPSVCRSVCRCFCPCFCPSLWPTNGPTKCPTKGPTKCPTKCPNGILNLKIVILLEFISWIYIYWSADKICGEFFFILIFYPDFLPWFTLILPWYRR